MNFFGLDIAVFSIILGVIAALYAGGRRLHKIFSGLKNLIDDWNGEPQRPGVPARLGVMARLDRIENIVNITGYNVQSNHGGSIYDHQMKILTEILEEVKNGKTLKQ